MQEAGCGALVNPAKVQEPRCGARGKGCGVQGVGFFALLQSGAHFVIVRHDSGTRIQGL